MAKVSMEIVNPTPYGWQLTLPACLIVSPYASVLLPVHSFNLERVTQVLSDAVYSSPHFKYFLYVFRGGPRRNSTTK